MSAATIAHMPISRKIPMLQTRHLDILHGSPPPRQFVNFSNDPPPFYSYSETTAKEALHADRAKAAAAEEAACESARLARMQAKGPPVPPQSTPIRPQDSTLKPASPFFMPATPTLLSVQKPPLSTPTSNATRQALSMGYKNDAGLTVYPPPGLVRSSPPPLTPRPPGTPKPDMREEFEASLELASTTMTMEDLTASADFSVAQKGIIFQKILAKQSAPLPRSPPVRICRSSSVPLRPPSTMIRRCLLPSPLFLLMPCS